jgi:hypothetical protein
LQFLESYGLPTHPIGLQVADAPAAIPTDAPSGAPTTAVEPMSLERPGLVVGLAVVFLLVALAIANLVTGRRRGGLTGHSSHSM